MAGVRTEHGLAKAPVTLARYAGARHVGVALRVRAGPSGPIDVPRAARGREREIAVVVGSLATDEKNRATAAWGGR